MARNPDQRRDRPTGGAPAARERRTIRIILILVVVGWLAALALMAAAAIYWDHG